MTYDELVEHAENLLRTPAGHVECQACGLPLVDNDGTAFGLGDGCEGLGVWMFCPTMATGHDDYDFETITFRDADCADPEHDGRVYATGRGEFPPEWEPGEPK
jgi:hypothetical protein